MSPLPTVENQFTPTTAWSTSVGSGIGNFYSNLHPALADNVVYAADRAGLVKALNADDGKRNLVCQRPRKMAGSLKSLHYFLAV